MPSINRIRVNNVKYNFGTQQYDDFVMRMYGRNTLYDLANGGGKSILMLLLLQNLIPNCTLDDKQPIEKLFRTGGGNTTIHSLVEWKLDETDQKDGYRYMTTGFCARKTKDSPDEEEGGKEYASVEYFNYVIFYRNYNDNDIVNLPLSKDGERVSYSGLKTYLKELSHRDMNLDIHIFERKGEYQRFIAKYGLYESHWEIVRGINKTEGHVRTYFETNYRTARKVVEDLLIEEIIEKAYLTKIDENNGTDDMARTLLDIKDKLVELAKKKREITDYDNQTELLHVLEARVASFLDIYEEQQKQRDNIASVYVTGESFMQESSKNMETLETSREKQLEAMNAIRVMLESLKIKREQIRLENIYTEIRHHQEELVTEEDLLTKCRDELNRKESMNDYLEYRKEQAEKEENEAVIEASLHQNEDQLQELQELAAERHRRDEEELSGLTIISEQEEKALNEAREEAERSERLLREAEIARAVADNERNRLKDVYQTQIKEMQELRQGLEDHTFLDAEDIQVSLDERKSSLQKEMEQAQEQIARKQQELHACDEELVSKQQLLTNAKQESDKIEENRKTYQDKKDALTKILTIYEPDLKAQSFRELPGSGYDLLAENADQAGNYKSAEWLSNEDLSRLLAAIQNRYLQNITLIANKKAQLSADEGRLEAWKEGRLILPTEAASKVKYYIESRHGISAVYGMDYLAMQDEEYKKELLSKHPLLPYGLLVEDYDTLMTDGKLRELKLQDGFVPIYNQAVLDQVSGDTDSGLVMFIKREKDAFLDTEALAEEERSLRESNEQLRMELERLYEMSRTYQEDSEFVLGLQGMAILDAEKRMLVLEDTIREQTAILQSLNERRQTLNRELTEAQDAYQSCQQTYYTYLTESGTLDAIRRLSVKLVETEEEQKASDTELRRLQAEVMKYEQEVIQKRSSLREHEHRLETIQITLKERRADWEQYYKSYYDETVAAGEQYRKLSGQELDARFKALHTVFSKATIVLEDKRRLTNTLQSSMERLMKAILRRGITMEELQNLEEEHKLYSVTDQELTDIAGEVDHVLKRVEHLKRDMESRREDAIRLEGSIAQAILTMEERYGAYEAPDVLGEHLEDKLHQEEASLAKLEEAYQISEKEYQKNHKGFAIMQELYKDVKRIIDVNEIDLTEAHVLSIEPDELRAAFELSLKSYDKSNKELERARQELQRYKGQTAQAIMEMQAFELAQTIRDDIDIPKNYGEAKELKDSIHSMSHVIELEKERIAKSIEDMQFIKDSFEKQCVERCQDVKNELEKLPKLSKIILAGEPIQMVGLTIPYVKDEFVEQRMSDYIDEVVSGADRYENQAERIRYIRGKLELKRLFSVIVTDMNNIKLTLYKRERIKEQSRYLKYEEAVGSTGQSQGIYIQFLVAVINYISGLYSPNVDNDKLMKTIFIDNPFGAAKDVYIWEPIFAMLATNHVQLIVPARGATPAITARFDVNYILGQQMVGKRQQTVVVDYRSQVEQEELEYRNLEYDQVSFDFI